MADVCLKNEGEQIAEINWGEYHLEIEPGELSRPMPENMARKFTYRNQCLKAVPAEEAPAPAEELLSAPVEFIGVQDAPPPLPEMVGEPTPYTPELEPKVEEAPVPEENHHDINRVGAAAKPRNRR